LKKSGLKKLSRTDEDARFMRQRGDKFVLGYSRKLPSRTSSDRGSAGDAERDRQRLARAYAGPDRTALRRPRRALADSGFSRSTTQPDGTAQHRRLCTGLQHGAALNWRRCRTGLRSGTSRMRPSCEVRPRGRLRGARRSSNRLRSSETTTRMRQFRTRGLKNVNNEFTWQPGIQHHPAARHARSLKQKHPTGVAVRKNSEQEHRCTG